MSEETKKVVSAEEAEIEKDYQNSFVPAIHNIGQPTMLLGAVLMFVPALVLYFVLGYNEIPFSTVISFAVYIVSLMAAGQLTEHLRFYPMTGSAVTYMGYLAGSNATLRMPVAQSCITAANAELFSAKGQIVAIVGVVVSVVVNIVILVLIVFFGDVILAILPAAVEGAFSFITMAIFGNLLVMNMKSNGHGDLIRGVKNIGWPLAVAAVGYLLFNVLLSGVPFIATNNMLCILLFSVAVFLIRQIILNKKEAAA